VLEKNAPGAARFAPVAGEESPPPAPAVAALPRSRSRAVFAIACTAVFAALTGGIAASWDGLLDRLSRAPAPRSGPGPTVAGETGASNVVGRARRLLAAGHAPAAIALLDSVSPADPAWPLARQLRAQAEDVTRGRAEPRR
jgi:hypothetical protein